jgi:hypothetical protein|tara:strand:- start:852 stop:1547 length:696 start_codon:yes stop_codon:yes gene_type:complete
MNMDSSKKYWPLEDRINKTFKTSGSDNSGLNTYTYNEIGYRGDSIHEKINLLTVGCSHTEGINVSDNETWPFYLSNELGYTHINLGYTGRSNDYISRVTSLYVRKFKPSIVAVMYTYPSRREYWTKYGPQPYTVNSWGYFDDYPNHHSHITELSNEYNNHQNFLKNHLIVQLACNAVGSKLVWNGSFIESEYTDSKRFDGDYFIEERHATAEENKEYSNKLTTFIKSSNIY